MNNANIWLKRRTERTVRNNPVVRSFAHLIRPQSSAQDSTGSSLTSYVPITAMMTLFHIDLNLSYLLTVDNTYFCLQLSVLLLLIYIIYRYCRWRQKCAVIDRIPGLPVHPLCPWIGHACIVLYLDRHKFQFGTYVQRICRIWIGLKPIVILFTPEAVEVILSSTTLTEKASEYKLLEPWLGDGLVTSSKSKWKTRRKILTPAFHFRILGDFLPVINEQSTVLIDKIRNIITDGNVDSDSGIDIVPIITLCTLDIICETAMGIKVGVQHNSNSDYVRALHDIAGLVLMRLMRPWLYPDWAFHCSQYGKQFKSCLEKMTAFTMKVIRDRKQQWVEHISRHRTANRDPDSGPQTLDDMRESNFFDEKKRLAFLDLLLHQHLITNTLTEEDLREEVDTFMFAGHDTTAQAISWALYMLGLHQDIQRRVREEVDSVMNSHSSEDDFTIDDIKQLKYLECVLKEVQRLYPTAPFIGRQLSEDTMINGYLVPKGTSCGIFTYILHRDNVQFPNPELFQPDRFLPENCIGRHPYAYVPFSAGPRNCIGQKFALLEQKIVVSKIIRNFEIEAVDQRDKLYIVGELVLRTRNGLKLIIRERKGSERRVRDEWTTTQSL